MAQVSAENAPHLAQGAVEFVQKKFGFALPCTPQSLLVVDLIVDKIRETGATEQQASGILAGLGCFAGEVFVRQAHGSWRGSAEMGMARTCRFPAVVALPGMVVCDPIGKVFQRYGAGAAESVAALFESLTAPATPPVPGLDPQGAPQVAPPPAPAAARSPSVRR